jgi:hypothetical protein
MKDFASYLANLPKTPLTEAVSALYESYGRWNFNSVQELRDFVDQKTYERFKLYSKNEAKEGKTPFGSLDAIKAIDMGTFLKSVGDKGYDIEDDMKAGYVDENYINNLSYDWFICLFNMKVLGWNKPVTEPITEATRYSSDMAIGLSKDGTYSLEDSTPGVDISKYPKWVQFLADKIDLRKLPRPDSFNTMMPFRQRLIVSLLVASPEENAERKELYRQLEEARKPLFSLNATQDDYKAFHKKKTEIELQLMQWQNKIDDKLKALCKGTRLPSRDNGQEVYRRHLDGTTTIHQTKPRVGSKQMEVYRKHDPYFPW